MQPQTPDQTRVDLFVRTADRDTDVAELIYQNSPHFYGSIGFHCQPAVEKYLKAGLVVQRLPVPRPLIGRACQKTYALSLISPRLTKRRLPYYWNLLLICATSWVILPPTDTSTDLLAIARSFQVKRRPLAIQFLT